MSGAARRWESALYEGVVRHRHHGPVVHRFETSVSMVVLDLAELDEVMAAIPWWSARRPAPVRFRRRDYLDGSDRPLAEGVVDVVGERLGRRPGGRVRMLTQLRTLGWLFNPLTVYWCDDEHGDPDAIVLEVTNTPWHERHCYVLDLRTPAAASAGSGASGRGVTPAPFPKELHVSPFLPMDLEYRLTTTGPGDQLELALEVTSPDHPGCTVFDAELLLDRVELTRASARAALVRHGWSTLAVSAAIRWQAVRLWAKRAPVHAHRPGRSEPAGVRS